MWIGRLRKSGPVLVVVPDSWHFALGTTTRRTSRRRVGLTNWLPVGASPNRSFLAKESPE